MRREERLLSWLARERERLEAEIGLLSSGRARRTETRAGRVLDVTGEALKDLQRRKRELDELARGCGAPASEPHQN